MAVPAATVLDRFWIFTCVAGADRQWLERGGITAPSRMTPAEGAFYLDVPNLILVRSEGQPAAPFDQFARSLAPLKRVAWSIVGSGGKHEDDELPRVLDLAARFPNITAVFMDDFFTTEGANLSLDELRSVRERLEVAGRRLDLFVVVYTHMLRPDMAPYLELCDVVTLWTWSSDDLKDLSDNFARLEALCPGARKLLGCYFWDYPNDKPVPLPLMQRQCATGLEWLREGRLDGMVFLGNTVADFGFESVEWTREWIRDVGQQAL